MRDPNLAVPNLYDTLAEAEIDERELMCRRLAERVGFQPEMGTVFAEAFANPIEFEKDLDDYDEETWKA